MCFQCVVFFSIFVQLFIVYFSTCFLLHVFSEVVPMFFCLFSIVVDIIIVFGVIVSCFCFNPLFLSTILLI